MRGRRYNINQHTENIIRISRHLGCAKRQLENCLRIFAAVHRKLPQLNENIALFVTAKVLVNCKLQQELMTDKSLVKTQRISADFSEHS